MNLCTNYKFKLKHAILPPLHIFYKLCQIRDKTVLFLSTILRMVVYYLIYILITQYNLFNIGKTVSNKTLIIITNIVLILSIISLLLVIIKQPELNETQIDKNVEEILDEVYPKAQINPANNITNSDAPELPKNSLLETRTIGKSEAEKISLPEPLWPPNEETYLGMPDRPTTIS